MSRSCIGSALVRNETSCGLFFVRKGLDTYALTNSSLSCSAASTSFRPDASDSSSGGASSSLSSSVASSSSSSSDFIRSSSSSSLAPPAASPDPDAEAEMSSSSPSSETESNLIFVPAGAAVSGAVFGRAMKKCEGECGVRI